MYDSVDDLPQREMHPFAKRPQKKLNITVITLSIFLPSIVFTCVFQLLSFSFHYKNPNQCTASVACFFNIVVVLGWVTTSSWKRRKEAKREVAWNVFLFATTFLAYILGVSCGQLNYELNMNPHYEILNLASYTNVDPATMNSRLVADAGRINFVEGAHLDITKSLGFKNVGLYCIAPVVTNVTLGTYDFWAVGMNCCSGHAPDFSCGEFNNKNARSGLKLMRQEQANYFRVAVQQAEAVHKIKAPHPVFFDWLEDPVSEVNAYQDRGFNTFFIGSFVYFFVQLVFVLVGSAVIAHMQ